MRLVKKPYIMRGYYLAEMPLIGLEEHNRDKIDQSLRPLFVISICGV